MTKLTQLEILAQCMKLFARTDIFSKPGIYYWWKLIKHCHKQGFLYVGFDGNKVNTAMIAYRIKKVSDIKKNEVPMKEDGNILYVLAYVTTSKDRFSISRFRRHFVRTNPEVEYIAYRKRNNDDDIRLFNVRSNNYGRIKQSFTTSAT